MMRSARPILTLLALMAGLAGAVVALAAPPDAYRLRSEDVIDITVLGLPQLDKTVTILPDGTITYPRLGALQAAGRTPDELRDLIYKGLDQFYNNLQVTVSVRQLHTDRVTVTGAVKNSGIYEMHRGWTPRELLATAGGITSSDGPPSPEETRATLVRSDGERIPLDVTRLLSGAAAEDLPALQPGDQLIVEDLKIQVWVEGQVARPSMVDLPPGATPLDALKQVGGATDQAALTRAFIRRGSGTIPVDLRRAASITGAGTPLPALRRYDTLVIPENKERIVLWGGVQKPGPYPVPEDEPLHLTQALALAGGAVPRARLSEVSVVHKVNGKAVQTRVNVEAILARGDLGQDILIQPGDLIYVPDPKQPGSFNPLLLLQSAAILFGL